MMRVSRLALACAFLLLAVPVANAQAQWSLDQLRKELIAPWLVTVQGEDRARLLRISEVSKDSEGSFLVNANFGWIDGPQTIVRIEMIQAKQDLTLIVRTNLGSIYSLRYSPNGNFTGTIKLADGGEKPAALERMTEDQVAQKVNERNAKLAARVYADEDRDWGVEPTKSPRTERLHAPTPKVLPGAKTVRAMELREMRAQSPALILIDVLDGKGHRTIPGARWLNEPGRGTFDRAERERFREDLEKLTAGSKSAPIVFFCLSSQCWLSYNAGLRAIELGYTNVIWFRGGTEAWGRAGQDMREAVPYRR